MTAEDIARVVVSLDLVASQVDFDPNADLDDDGAVTESDLVIVTDHLGGSVDPLGVPILVVE